MSYLVLRNTLNKVKPFVVVDRVEYACIKPFNHFFLYYFLHDRIQSPMVFHTRSMTFFHEYLMYVLNGMSDIFHPIEFSSF